MPTDTTVQRSALQPGPKVNVGLTDTAKDQTSSALTLTAEQSRVLDQLLAPLDRASTAIRLGFFGKRMVDRNILLDYLTRPAGARRLRTPEHRKVVTMRLDALTLPDGMQPWHFLTLSLIEALTENALPNERMALNELRNEANKVVRLARRDPAAAEMPALSFARHFQVAFPKLVLNTVSLTNSILLVILNQVDETDPANAAQWIEASQYFCNTSGCAVLLSAEETALIDKLHRSAEGADGADILKQWLTRRVDFTAAVQPLQSVTVPTLIPTQQASEKVSPKGSSSKGASSRAADVKHGHSDEVPATSARIIRDALQPDMAAVEMALAQWHVAMQSVIRRAEQGLGSSISAALIAKLVCLHSLAPTLYDAARYDAQMLFALERASKGDESSDIYAEWANQLRQHPKLAALFTMDPSFAHFDLRDLATALRLTNADEVLHASASDVAALQASPAMEKDRGRKSMGAPQRARATAQALEDGLVISQAALSTGLAASIIFLLDRIVKLIIQSTPAGPEGALIHPEFLNANAATGNLWGGGLGVGSELFGLVLAILIAIFWGGTRRQPGHAISLGLIVGALASNLFDRLAYGSVLNYVHLVNLPVFNLSHVALVVGALMIAITLMRGPAPATAETTIRA